MRKIRTYQDVTHDTGSGLLKQVVDQQHRLADRLALVRSVVAVASGKGGVGKSAITANLAAALAARGLAVGAADADLNGPSLGRMLGVSGARLADRPTGVAPAQSPSGVRVMSMELLQEEEDAPLRWREPEMGGFMAKHARNRGPPGVPWGRRVGRTGRTPGRCAARDRQDQTAPGAGPGPRSDAPGHDPVGNVSVRGVKVRSHGPRGLRGDSRVGRKHGRPYVSRVRPCVRTLHG